ncbi:SDR family oxidoreductase [Oryzihumus leptocrescens]|uniref:NAD(P)-dependent dehydrogenase (Short-subunit alcohol dehydrogenase family) n=1 Tax=Oryzihumus leptocrescens TaxID=297536 RepID=A0A542ZKU1_9MICO|nr:SDR family oxidoreductase [Oryzihumus leptocrescens]TQL60908.1 NAD(P)-dependent dehydrogenase (short-subunit alcohol dehydrogenase family) [Oryzihumus leptocrescens]
MSTSMTGRTVLVTGGTHGIGLATAQALVSSGAAVTLVGRNADKTGRVVEALRRDSGNDRVEGMVADLSSQAEVRRLATDFAAAHDRLDVLVNNVGGFWATRHVTADGLERTFALNHLAPFLLTHLLRPLLEASAPSRVVTVSSGAQAMGRIDFADLQGERSYGGQRAYSQSKLANVLFTYELARRLEGTGVTANALHPGVVRTGFGQEDSSALFRVMLPVVRPFMLSPERGAETSVYLASSPEVEGVSGKYFVRKKARRSSPASYDAQAARRLWEVSAELTGVDAG